MMQEFKYIAGNVNGRCDRLDTRMQGYIRKNDCYIAAYTIGSSVKRISHSITSIVQINLQFSGVAFIIYCRYKLAV
jgi:hypothetical protein